MFLFADEAFWAGDKSGEGALKGLVTEDVLVLERKGIDAIPMRNRVKLMMASNNDWVVPVSADERRYFVLDVSDQRKKDRVYFNNLHAAIEGDELPAFFHHLLTLDLPGFNVRDVPNTKGLAEQKLVGADSVAKFWHACLHHGAIVGCGIYDWAEAQDPGVVGERSPVNDAALVKRLRELWDGCQTSRVRPRAPWVDPNQIEVERPQRYALDSLNDHRAAFLRAMKIDPDHFEWPGIREPDQ